MPCQNQQQQNKCYGQGQVLRRSISSHDLFVSRTMNLGVFDGGESRKGIGRTDSDGKWGRLLEMAQVHLAGR